VPEARRQQVAWSKYIDFSKVKAFVNIAISPALEWGVRNLALSAGLGGMRPNIAVIGFYNMDDLNKPKLTTPPPPKDTVDRETEEDGETALKDDLSDDNDGLNLSAHLPTDSCQTESTTSIVSYITVLEDLLLRLQINVAVARGFNGLELPNPNGPNNKKYIDLWPIQMSAEIATEGAMKANLLTTNFDTCKSYNNRETIHILNWGNLTMVC
jgi:potassium/chloride transporter 9